jgi:phytoene desaturase
MTMRAIIAGAGPAGFATAKWLNDRGYQVVLLEKRDVPGGKVSAWQDPDGDWVESGLHVFFGAYHNLLNFLAEVGLQDSFDWKPAEMVFALPGGKYGSIEFVQGLPAPFNGLLGVAKSELMTWSEKLAMGRGLMKPIFGSQDYIDQQADITYRDWHLAHGMGQSTIDKVMDAMALALNFQKADKVSAKLVLTALLHFAKETDAPKMGLVKGSPHERLWVPLMKMLSERGVEIRFNSKVSEIVHDKANNRVTGVRLEDGSELTADIVISAMPVHSLRKVMSDSMREFAVLDNLKHLKGQPVITVQLYFDNMVTDVDNLIFSAGTHISVYADLARVAPDYHKGEGSIIELVVAPAEELIRRSDEEIIAAVMNEFTTLHPAATMSNLRKSHVIRIPNSVYAARPGVEKYRPDQATPIPNFFLTGDYTQQEFMASIEGSIRSARRTVARIDSARQNGTI